MSVETGVKDEVTKEEHEVEIEVEDCSGWVLSLN
jgi:hypothetical protein